jgi:hypothetical protein
LTGFKYPSININRGYNGHGSLISCSLIEAIENTEHLKTWHSNVEAQRLKLDIENADLKAKLLAADEKMILTLKSLTIKKGS